MSKQGARTIAVTEVADELGVSTGHIYKQIREGIWPLRVTKIGRRYLMSRAEFDAEFPPSTATAAPSDKAPAHASLSAPAGGDHSGDAALGAGGAVGEAPASPAPPTEKKQVPAA